MSVGERKRMLDGAACLFLKKLERRRISRSILQRFHSGAAHAMKPKHADEEITHFCSGECGEQFQLKLKYNTDSFLFFGRLSGVQSDNERL